MTGQKIFDRNNGIEGNKVHYVSAAGQNFFAARLSRGLVEPLHHYSTSSSVDGSRARLKVGKVKTGMMAVVGVRWGRAVQAARVFCSPPFTPTTVTTVQLDHQHEQKVSLEQGLAYFCVQTPQQTETDCGVIASTSLKKLSRSTPLYHIFFQPFPLKRIDMVFNLIFNILAKVATVPHVGGNFNP